ncbi:ATP-dependent RNA helicase rhlB [Mannheimia haemolytica]|uniref:ATP-dependent RNA helicase rhlB n=1 Tax=Mannheimia haemolytica TaxID=75985 RepID=A0A378N8Q5_MANHA|nr:ATP-dependent RNA helicase rhlB [Mannheimia haemolytica]
MSNHLTEHRFIDFPIHANVLNALDSKGFEFVRRFRQKPFDYAERQRYCRASSNRYRENACLLIATFNHLLNNEIETSKNQPRALILAPTRELAVQIGQMPSCF